MEEERLFLQAQSNRLTGTCLMQNPEKTDRTPDPKGFWRKMHNFPPDKRYIHVKPKVRKNRGSNLVRAKVPPLNRY